MLGEPGVRHQINMKIILSIISFLFLITSCSVTKDNQFKIPDTLKGMWNIQIKNTQNEVINTMVVTFSGKEAKSCLGGDWKVLNVKSYKNIGKNTFPAKDPLSYQFKDNNLTIGRNEICDGYLHLSGNLKDSKVNGKYTTFGITGGSILGSFSIQRSGN